MNKNTGIVVGVIVAVIIVGVYAFTDNKREMMVKTDVVTRPETMVKTDAMAKPEVMAKTGVYEIYSADKLSRAETGDVVLFFYASWCPSCRGLNLSIENNLNSIPENVSILKTDYDKEIELKKKYGVTYQHTLVQVDKDGNMIKKWSGGSTLENLLSHIQ